VNLIDKQSEESLPVAVERLNSENDKRSKILKKLSILLSTDSEVLDDKSSEEESGLGLIQAVSKLKAKVLENTQNVERAEKTVLVMDLRKGNKKLQDENNKLKLQQENKESNPQAINNSVFGKISEQNLTEHELHKKEVERHKQEVEKHNQEVKKHKQEVENHKKEVEKHHQTVSKQLELNNSLQRSVINQDKSRLAALQSTGDEMLLAQNTKYADMYSQSKIYYGDGKWENPKKSISFDEFKILMTSILEYMRTALIQAQRNVLDIEHDKYNLGKYNQLCDDVKGYNEALKRLRNEFGKNKTADNAMIILNSLFDHKDIQDCGNPKKREHSEIGATDREFNKKLNSSTGNPRL
jgi:hypothetical protein